MRPFLSIILFFCGFPGFAQSEQLARNYFEQGEFEKSLQVYEKLNKDDPNNREFFFGVISSLQQLRQFEAAEELLLNAINNSANNPSLLVELGHNNNLKQDREKADLYFKEALAAVEARPNYAFSISKAFEKYSLLDYAIQAMELGMTMNTDYNFHIQLARLYGEQGKIEEMLANYIDLIAERPELLPSIVRGYSQFITEDPENEANIIFRKLVLKKLQETQNTTFNEMLSWLFMQQGEYDKAFLQEKAIYRRSQSGLGRIMQLSLMAREKEPKTSLEVLEFIIEESQSTEIRLQASQLKLSLQRDLADQQEFARIEQEYRDLLTTYGKGFNSLSLQLDFANFMSFNRGKHEEALQGLKSLLDRNPGKFEEASLKMAMADILVMDEKFNQALIYYTQVQQLVKNDVLAQDARFKVAKTSYYKGDFAWAKTQLDILKASTSQLIANDAMEMSLLISDNSLEDSTQAALKKYAKADLLAFQNKDAEAIALLGELLVQHKGESMEDEALLKQAELYENQGNFEEAETNYLQLITHYADGILGDNAHYQLAELYANHLGEPEKARDFYEKIVFNYADSIYFVDSRKKYRELRGDGIE